MSFRHPLRWSPEFRGSESQPECPKKTKKFSLGPAKANPTTRQMLLRPSATNGSSPGPAAYSTHRFTATSTDVAYRLRSYYRTIEYSLSNPGDELVSDLAIACNGFTPSIGFLLSCMHYRRMHDRHQISRIITICYFNGRKSCPHLKKSHLIYVVPESSHSATSCSSVLRKPLVSRNKYQNATATPLQRSFL